MSSTHRPGPRLVQKRLMPMPPQPVPGQIDVDDALVDEPTVGLDHSLGASLATARGASSVKSLECQAFVGSSIVDASEGSAGTSLAVPKSDLKARSEAGGATMTLDTPEVATLAAATSESPSECHHDGAQGGGGGRAKGVAVGQRNAEGRETPRQGEGNGGTREAVIGMSKPARMNTSVRRRQRDGDSDGDRGDDAAAGGSGRGRGGAEEAKEEEAKEEVEDVKKKNAEKKMRRRRASAPCGMLHCTYALQSVEQCARSRGRSFRNGRNTMSWKERFLTSAPV